MGKKPVVRYIDVGQDCWDIDEHLIRSMEDLIPTIIVVRHLDEAFNWECYG